MKDFEMDFDFAVSANRWSMRLIGLWPIADKYSNYRYFATHCLTYVYLLPQFTALFVLDDGNVRAKALNTLIPCFAMVIKLSIMKTFEMQMKRCLEQMIEDWNFFQLTNERNKKTMIHYAKLSRFITFTYLMFMLFTLAGFFTRQAFVPGKVDSSNATQRRMLPAIWVVPFDEQKSPTFEILYFCQCLTFSVCGMTNASMDCFMALLIFHYCGQLKILCNVLENYDGRNRHADVPEKRVFSVCACMRCIVERHVQLVSSVEIMETSFNPLLLVELCSSALLLCFQAYEFVMSIEENNAITAITFILYIFTLSIEILMHCYAGEELLTMSDEFGYTAYKLKWYEIPSKSARYLLLLILRSRKPLKITGGKFFVISMSCYKNMLSTSGSYFSVLMAIK